jgi:hypothetical protein
VCETGVGIWKADDVDPRRPFQTQPAQLDRLSAVGRAMMVYAGLAPPETDSPAKPSELIGALNHSIRRSVLRALLELGSASSTQIHTLIPSVGGNNLNFHLDILVTSGAVSKEKRVGYRENFFVPTKALQDQWLLTALQLTAAED